MAPGISFAFSVPKGRESKRNCLSATEDVPFFGGDEGKANFCVIRLEFILWMDLKALVLLRFFVHPQIVCCKKSFAKKIIRDVLN